MHRRTLAFLLSVSVELGCAGARSREGPQTWVELDSSDSDAWSPGRVLRGRASSDCRVELEHRSSERVQRSAVVRTDETFEQPIALAPGENELVISCGSQPSSRRTVRWNARVGTRPTARIEAQRTAEGLVRFTSISEPSTVGAALTECRFSGAASSEECTFEVPLPPGSHRIELEVTDARGAHDQAALRIALDERSLRIITRNDPESQHAKLADEMVLYGVVPHLFGTAGLDAVTSRLDVLAQLGVNALWLSPIYPSPGDDYGYAVLDWFGVRPSIGDQRSLRELIEAAHARGMSVLLDFVPNHLSREHPYAAQAAELGPRSAYWDYFERNEEGEPTHYFDWEHLPNLNYENPEVRAFVTAGFEHWVREFDIDGYRIDAAWGVHRRRPDFFPQLAQALHRIEPDVVLIAEASATDRSWQDAGFDAAYDWTEEVGHWSFREPLASPPIDVRTLRQALTLPAIRAVRFLDNNDTGERIRTRLGGPAYDALSAMLFALPGIPTLFTGDEVGAEYSPYLREEPLSFEPSIEASAALRRRIDLRKQHASLRTGVLELVDARPAQQVLAFRRTGANESLLVLINLSATPVEATVPAALRIRSPEDLLSQRVAPIRSSANGSRIELASWDAKVFAVNSPPLAAH